MARPGHDEDMGCEAAISRAAGGKGQRGGWQIFVLPLRQPSQQRGGGLRLDGIADNIWCRAGSGSQIKPAAMLA